MNLLNIRNSIEGGSNSREALLSGLISKGFVNGIVFFILVVLGGL